jgi:hypothetical protein
MSQTSLNSTGVASTGALSLQSNGTTEAIGISTGQVATLAQNPVLTSGTANGVAYLNGSKVVTTGSALTFDGTRFTVVGGNANSLRVDNGGQQYTEIDIANAGTVKASIYWDNTNTNLFYSSNGSATYASGAASYHSWNISSEQMRLTSTGLGIGTSSPAVKLDVVGAISSTGNIRSNGKAYIGSSGTFNWGTTGADGILSWDTGKVLIYGLSGKAIEFGTNNTVAATLDTSGNLGLGVTPSAWYGGYKALQFGGLTAIASIQTNDGLNLTSNAYAYGSNTWKYLETYVAARYEIGGGAHQWYVAPSGTQGTAITFTQAMTLDASGNLLVGTTTNSYTSSTGFVVNPGGSYAALCHPSGAGSGSSFLIFSYNGGLIGNITQAGTTGVLYNVTSDYRLKEVIGAVSGSGERIDALQPIDYAWKSSGEITRGFLAHKFQEVYPNSVSGEKDAVDVDGKPVYQAMQASTSEVIADLVAEIQSLRKRLANAGI